MKKNGYAIVFLMKYYCDINIQFCTTGLWSNRVPNSEGSQFNIWVRYGRH